MTLLKYQDSRWAFAWLSGTGAVAIWDILFLNKPALAKVSIGFINTFSIAVCTAVFTLLLAWTAAYALYSMEESGRRTGRIVVTFLLNLTRSVPQIVGILFGYIGIAALRAGPAAGLDVTAIPLLALCISIFIFPEMADLMLERIAYYKTLDFYNAMRVCGISERRIVNFHILWRNSRAHILNKLISVFGMAVFLQCSVDFIISVGLSQRVSDASLPATLGSLLSKIDSKQDILAIGYTFTNPAYLSKLLFQHLQGLTVAFLIVYTLVCVHYITIGFSRRHRL